MNAFPGNCETILDWLSNLIVFAINSGSTSVPSVNMPIPVQPRPRQLSDKHLGADQVKCCTTLSESHLFRCIRHI